MKKQILPIVAVALIGFAGCSKSSDFSAVKPNAVAAVSNNLVQQTSTVQQPYKVAYYAFDHGGPRITTFSPYANVVVLFEGTPFELADSVHYGSSSSYIKSNPNYPTYASLIADIHTLQASGVKVLWNIDDASSWQTTAPFKTYNNTSLSASQYAAFVKACVIDSLHLDGIALDQEHISPYSTTPNSNYLSVLNNLASYFGLTSSNPSTIFTSATGYNVAYGLQPIQNNAAYAADLNFVMDMGYGVSNSTRVNTRLPPFANIANFGWPKTMTGVNTEDGSGQLAQDILSAQWQPSGSYKAGIMVYAANGDTSYAGQVFRALSTSTTGGGGDTTTTGVVFYQNTNYGGTATQAIPKGNYTLSQLQSYGFVNDWASSVQIPSGWKVIMYKDNNLSGKSWTLTSSNSNFVTLSPNANDVVSSVKIQ